MKHVLTILIILSVLAGRAQESYVKARILLDEEGVGTIATTGIDLQEGFWEKDNAFITVLSDLELARLREAGFDVEVLIEDLGTFYRERARSQQPYGTDRELYGQWPVPEQWEYGSMGGFYTMEEALAELDSMHMLYPELITERQAISQDTLTWEGRETYWLRISDNPDSDEDEPEVFFNSMHHAREVIGLQQQIFFMWYLLENYDNDSTIRYLIDNTEIYFVPIVNPDGFQYNCTTYPEGGGMWRKNRRDNEDGTYGVDLNRNYGFAWAYDDQGSSPSTGDATYRGPAAFSEPETRNMRDFCNAHEFRITLNYHSHGNLLLSPWGYTPDLPEDSTLFNEYSELMTRENIYVYGPGNTSIYPTNGSSDDWMYGGVASGEAILSYTPEIGGDGDGFWPEPQRIIPLCREQMWQNLTAVRLVGKYALARDLGPTVIGQESGYLTFEIRRMGLLDCELFTVSIEPLDDHLAEVGDPVQFENMELLESRIDSIGYLLEAGIQEGTEIRYLLRVNNGEITYQDTVTRIFGEEVVLFADDCENFENWSSNDWDTTGVKFFSPMHSITDSPEGNYEDSRTTMANLDTIIDLQDALHVFLRFHATWEIEEGYDYVQLLISPAGETDWQPLGGLFTSTGSVFQDPGKPVYDGMSEWVAEEIDITEYAGKSVRFRFWMRSDNYVNGDGFYFDDFEVSAILGNMTNLPEADGKSPELYLSAPFPNPSDGAFQMNYSIDEPGNTRLELLDSFGRVVYSRQLDEQEGTASISKVLAKGIYFCRLVEGNNRSRTHKLIVR